MLWKTFFLTGRVPRRENRCRMARPSVSALLSAAAYLSNAAEDLRHAGYRRLADEVDRLITVLDVESFLSETLAGLPPRSGGES